MYMYSLLFLTTSVEMRGWMQGINPKAVETISKKFWSFKITVNALISLAFI